MFQDVECAPNEICKHFDTKSYRCPAEILNCRQYEKMSRMPICVSTKYHGNSFFCNYVWLYENPHSKNYKIKYSNKFVVWNLKINCNGDRDSINLS